MYTGAFVHSCIAVCTGAVVGVVAVVYTSAVVYSGAVVHAAVVVYTGGGEEGGAGWRRAQACPLARAAQRRQAIPCRRWSSRCHPTAAQERV